MNTCYSAPSRFLLRGAPDYSADTESEFHAEAHEQLRVKDLPRVPTRRLEVDSNPQPSSCKAPNIPLHHRAPVVLCCIVLYCTPCDLAPKRISAVQLHPNNSSDILIDITGILQ